MDTFYDLEDETAALALQLQLSDSLELSGSYIRKGKNTKGRLTDAQLALQIYTEDLQRNATLVSDRRITEIIGSESLDDETFDEMLENLESLYVSPPVNTTGSDFAESSSQAASRVEPAGPYVTCTACLENIRSQDAARVPCGHQYCRTCLQKLFRAAIRDDSLFPPKCCRQLITADAVRTYLTRELVRQYEDKKIEYETPDRTYCFNASCSTFIRVENISNEQARCPRCYWVTCTMCKGGAHRGDCPADTGLQLVLATAYDNGWQRCYNCRRVVELDVGCNHISCPCGAEFCYTCGRRWKTCDCEQWDEDRLFEQANQVVDREPIQANVPQRRERVDAVAQNLRQRHDCDHERWTYVGGSHFCEECYNRMPSYIFECQECRIQTCNRCRKNRL